ncbi:TM0106 family RecB-like putative nuclease [Herbiconiux sp. 11R-BC]|uniref:TM0106 family RecB-like putative nuclease n=1 Tax=Herbiconiux sp. 11R-BC TaxID=3111637 RepID=UPI003C06D86B
MIVTESTGGGLGDPTVLYSATDLTAAADCEFALVRRLDAKLGRVGLPDQPVDQMLERTARLGDAHELRTLERFRAEFGVFDGSRAAGVAEIERPARTTPAELRAQQELTAAALRAGADVVFQGTFFDGRFLGFADFLVRADAREPDGAARSARAAASGHAAAPPRAESPRYEVYDTKLARHAKITALLQLAAYAEQLERLGVPLGPRVHLLLGDGSTSSHLLRDVLPVFLDRRRRLEALLDERVGASVAPVEWGDPRYTACGRCDVCSPEVTAHRDLLLVAGLRHTQRQRMLDAGIRSIDELASSLGPVPGIGENTLAGLRDQAHMQLAPAGAPRYRVFDTAPLAALPVPDPGDIFFDFEGDPLYSEGGGPDWGLDYLFGVVEHDPAVLGGTVFRPFWAHDHAEEREALRDFLDYATARLREHPRMHVYHYANYERAHLQSLCARHGVGEEQLDELLRRGVLVDLYPVVKQSIRVSSPSYSLKKLEPLYMGSLLRDSAVTNAADSIVEYAQYVELRERGRTDAVAEAEARRRLGEIADYNQYDCVSTLRLRDWLLARAAEHGVAPGPGDGAGSGSGDEGAQGVGGEEATALDAFEPSPVHRALVERIEHVPPADRTDDETALALAAAAIDYHRREDKSFWWEHYARLEQPLEDWADTRDVLAVEAAVVDREWYRSAGQRSDRREVRLRGELAPGSRLEESSSGRYFVYDPPHPWSAPRSRASDRVAHDRTRLDEVRVLPTGLTQYVFEERLPMAGTPYAALPVAVAPAAPPKTASLQAAILEWGQSLVEALPAFPADPAVDILRRGAPRRRDGMPLAPLADGARGPIDAIRDSLLALDDSYLAVQGPPGTGKTYTGAGVVAELVNRHGWNVGVVAQSHAVVENMLEAIVAAGVEARRVGKASDSPDAGFTVLRKERLGAFLSTGRENGESVVVGGTAWDFTNTARVGRRQLDLLVIDEAGQYSLANTIAVSVAARNLLLLGDPQQLPQVTLGTHPEPVDSSALGWLTAGHDVLPAERGYFLGVSWRMHPAVCAPVSELSYEGELRARLPETTARFLEGVPPGLHLHPVEHRGNSTQSPEEAERVVELVRGVLGRSWSDPGESGAARPAAGSDVIVVAPYNAQVERIRAALLAAGLDGVPVGTVDKFQGREAAVAIVSLAASAAVDVPRGIGFLLMKNRLNVAVSRAKWAAHLVFSPRLTEHLPAHPDDLATLSAFLRFTRDAHPGAGAA